MTPTLLGRIETRLALLATVGVVWTVIITPFLPHPVASDMAMNGMFGSIMLKNMLSVSTGQLSTTAMDYHMAFDALAMMAGFGILWECVYHLLQQMRRDRDWPPLFMLLEIVPEATLIWFALHAIRVTANTLWPSSSDMPMFAIQMLSTWVIVWAVSLGPVRVFSPRWHLQGMEFWRPGTANAGAQDRTPSHNGATSPNDEPLVTVGSFNPEYRSVPNVPGSPADVIAASSSRSDRA